MAPKLKNKTVSLAELAQDEPDIADLSQAYHDAGYQDRGRREGGSYGNDFGGRRGYGEGYGRRHEEGTGGDDGPWRRDGDRPSYNDRPSYGGERPAYRGGDDFGRGGRGGDDMGRRQRDEPGEEDVATSWRTSGVTRKRDAAPMGREGSMGMGMGMGMNARPLRATESSEGNEDSWRRGKPAATMGHTDSVSSMSGAAPVKRKFDFKSAVGHLPEPAPMPAVIKSESSQPTSESVAKPEASGYRAAAMKEDAPAKPAGRFAGLSEAADVRPARRLDSEQQSMLRRAEPSRPNRFESVNDPLPSRPVAAAVEMPALARTDGPKKSDGVVLAPMTMGSGKAKKDLLNAPKIVGDSAFQRNQMRTDAATAALLHEEKKEKKVKKVNERKRAMMAARASGHSSQTQHTTRDPACYKNLLEGSIKNLEILAAHFETLFEKDAPPTQEEVTAFMSGLPAMLDQAEEISEETLVLATLFASLIKEVMSVCEETIETQKFATMEEVSNEQLENTTDKFVIPAAVKASKKADVFLQELSRTSSFGQDFPFVAMQTLARLLAKAEGPRISASLTFAETILIGLLQATTLFTPEVILDWVDDREDECEGRAGALAQILHLSDALRGNLPAPEEEEDAQDVDAEEEDE